MRRRSMPRAGSPSVCPTPRRSSRSRVRQGPARPTPAPRMIVELVRAGRRVGISAQAHKAITNLLVETVEAAREAGVPIRALQRIDGGEAADRLDEVDRGLERRDRRGARGRDRRRRRRDELAVRPSRARADRSTSCSSTKPVSSRSPTPWRPRPRPDPSSCSAIPTSCPRSARASTPTAPAPRPSSTSSATSGRSPRTAACSCRSPTGCIPGSIRS